MFCTRCGRAVPEGARFCGNCGAPVTTVTVPDPGADPAVSSSTPTAPFAPFAPAASAIPAAPAGVGPPLFSPYAVAGEVAGATVTPRYAGFWRRFWALFLDAVLLNIVMTPLYLLWVFPVMMSVSGRTGPEDMDPATAWSVLGTMTSFMMIGGVVGLAYFAGFESSGYQATLGKLALGIRVSDLEGRRIGFGRALLRRLARIITDLTFLIGYLMMLWTQRRQTLHDLMAGTLVVRRPE